MALSFLRYGRLKKHFILGEVCSHVKTRTVAFKSTAVSSDNRASYEARSGARAQSGIGASPKNRALSDDGHPVLDLTFSNAREAYKSKSTVELIRASLVFNLCSIQWLVNNNRMVGEDPSIVSCTDEYQDRTTDLLQASYEVLKWSRGLLGPSLFKNLMKTTFYGHFVAGEDLISIRPLVTKNQQYGVKSILDYSAEEDESTEKAKEAEIEGCLAEDVTEAVQDPDHQRVMANREFGDGRGHIVSSQTYYYEGEELCDKNMHIFLDCIDGVSDATDKTGFCAVKLTALGRPQLLLQMSDVLVSAREFFDKLTQLETDSSGFKDTISRGFREDEFLVRLRDMGVDVTEDDCKKWFSLLDLSQDGTVDILDWDNLLEFNMSLFKLFVVPDPKTGQLVPLLSSMSEDTENEMKNMLHRVDTIARYAKEKDVRVMIDAEQTYFQPAICRLTMEMMKKFNKEKAIIFNTYQCYLKDAHDNIRIDLDTATRHDIYFGAKLVRGAYMEQERERAASLGYDDPINANYEATTAMYNKVLREVMRQIQMREKGKIDVMVASHNEETVKYTVEKMKEFDIKPSDRLISFGQLLGMCDQISFPLGQAGYSVYKYVPYGPVEEVLPYLCRRAMENRGVLAKVKKEKKLLRSEIFRRLRHRQLKSEPPV